MRTKLTFTQTLPKLFYVVITTIFLLCAVIIGLGLIALPHLIQRTTNATMATPRIGGGSVTQQKGELQPIVSSPDLPPHTSGSPQPGDNKSNAGGNITTSLLTPTGDFVSTHGSAKYPITSTTSITSVCNTTSGATCQILFVKDSDSISQGLPLQITDRAGATYWNNWTPQQYGITEGLWHIQAVTSMGGLSKISIDPQPFTVWP